MKELCIVATCILLAICLASAIGRREESAELAIQSEKLDAELGQFGHWDHYRQRLDLPVTAP